jgi:hypothetical protein
MTSISNADLILSGSDLPTNQGWTQYRNFSQTPEVSTDGTDLRIKTVNTPNILTSERFNLYVGPALTYAKALTPPADLGYTNYAYVDVEAVLQVYEATFNYLDGGLVLMHSDQPNGQLTPGLHRMSALMWSNTGIAWGDLSGSYGVDTTDGLHTYRYVGDATGARVYVDGILALERPDFYSPGGLVFGDWTNDLTYESDYRIRSLSATVTDSWQELPPVPLPGAALLSVLGLGYSGWRLRRQAC